MGVDARIVLYCEDEEAARSAARSAFKRMSDLDSVLSDYRANSELMQLCKTAGGNSKLVSKDLLNVLERAQEISIVSGGAFDITVGPLVRLWRTARSGGIFPNNAAINKAMTWVGWEKIIIDSSANSVKLKQPGMILDLGGIGKGFAVDEAMKTLAGVGINICLVDLGGDIAAGAPPPDKKAWIVSVRDGSDIKATINLLCKNKGIATSGDSEQFLKSKGKRYSHIIDPRTGMALTNRIAVTVVAQDCTTADALASAISVLGPTEAKKLLKKFPHTFVQIAFEASDGTWQKINFGSAPFVKKQSEYSSN